MSTAGTRRAAPATEEAVWGGVHGGRAPWACRCGGRTVTHMYDGQLGRSMLFCWGAALESQEAPWLHTLRILFYSLFNTKPLSHQVPGSPSRSHLLPSVQAPAAMCWAGLGWPGLLSAAETCCGAPGLSQAWEGAWRRRPQACRCSSGCVLFKQDWGAGGQAVTAMPLDDQTEFRS